MWNQRKWLVMAVCAVAALSVGVGGYFVAQEKKDPPPPEEKKTKAPELEGGVAWLNTGKPISIAKDLKGKVVLLDFWTLCCINCIHVMPDLAKLEKKYEKELVVIGVHSAKFENEKNSESIRKAILRYQIQHPVVNDAEMKIWDSYGANSWPTFVLIDPEGNVLGATSGEGNYELLDKVIGKVIEEHKKKGTLDEKPIRFDTAQFRDKVDSPLYFPGKLLADEKSNRLFVADSTNHRIVISDLAGKVSAVVGTGKPGYKNGSFADAQFDDPQGMALLGDTLFVADRKNHSIRAVDLKAKTVTTYAGTGMQGEDRELGGPIAETKLNSPWALLINGKQMYVAMAGFHQIWVVDMDKKDTKPFAGNGRENIKDGPHYFANFAQPSGLTTDGTTIFVADSETSSIRAVPMNGEGRVSTLVGTGLFDFGDEDGVGKEAKLQHCLGVLYHEGLLYVADTYNSKLKTIDLKTNKVTTILGPGKDAKAPELNEPGGLSIAGGKIYIADTNAHRIRVYDLKTKALTTLTLSNVQPVTGN
ncbi:MAG: thioredoxin-like domain-containing protein [Zavarzinella sp.]